LMGRNAIHIPLPSPDALAPSLVVRWSSMLPAALTAPAAFFTALGYCLFALGGIHAFTRVAPEVPQPRIRNLRRMARFTSAYSLAAIGLVAVLIGALVPPEVR